MFAGGAAAIIGSLLDWVTITPPPRLPAREVENAQPFTGIETGDGWWVIAGGVLLIAGAFLVVLRRRSGWAWLAFLASVVIGSIAIADYRGIGDLSSSISRRMEIVGEARPAVGITLVAAGALVGLIASVAAVAATPRR